MVQVRLARPGTPELQVLLGSQAPRVRRESKVHLDKLDKPDKLDLEDLLFQGRQDFEGLRGRLGTRDLLVCPVTAVQQVI